MKKNSGLVVRGEAIRTILCLSLTIAMVVAGAIAQAQQPGKIFRIGFLDSSTAAGSAILLETFRQELGKLGWIEGKNITIEYRFSENKGVGLLPELAANLARLKVDLIVATDTPSALAAKNATSGTPIVMANVGDPVGASLVASLARPEGNVTGLASLSPELITKRLEILNDAVPKLTRVGFLRPSGRGIAQDSAMKGLAPAAQALTLKLEEIETQPDAKGLESAFQTGKRKQATRL